MQNKQEIADAIFKSIDVIVNKKLEQLAFDRTIVGEIVEEDSRRGYKIKYQDSFIYAHAICDATYKKNDIVYVLIPNNSSKRVKFIIGKISASQQEQAAEYRLRRENAILRETLQLLIDGDKEAAQQKLNEIKES